MLEILIKTNMKTLLKTLKFHNPILYYAGLANLLIALALLLLMPFWETKVLGINSLIKPVKFSISIWIYSWTFAFILHDFINKKTVKRFSITASIIMGIEQLIIIVQAFRGKQSHFNQDSWPDAIAYMIMGILIGTITIYTLIVSIIYIRQKTNIYTGFQKQSIEIGLIFFVFFSFYGGYMSGINKHTVGGLDGSDGIAFLNWSRLFGDLRIAHFFGLHSLQIIPLFAFFIESKLNRNTVKAYLYIFASLYLILVLGIMIQAINGKPLV